MNTKLVYTHSIQGLDNENPIIQINPIKGENDSIISMNSSLQNLRKLTKVNNVPHLKDISMNHDEDKQSNISRNGRWNKAECKLFEEALQKFGTHWKKVEAYIGTRTGTQVRSHAQKYFLKIKEKTKKEKEAIISPVHENSSNDRIVTIPKKSESDISNDTNNDKKNEDNENTLLEKLPPLDLSISRLIESNLNTLPNQNVLNERNQIEITKKEIDYKEAEMKSNSDKCKFLLEYMMNYGISNLEEIYARYCKLSDWIP